MLEILPLTFGILLSIPLILALQYFLWLFLVENKEW